MIGGVTDVVKFRSKWVVSYFEVGQLSVSASKIGMNRDLVNAETQRTLRRRVKRNFQIGLRNG